MADTSVTGLEETPGHTKLSGTGVICLEETLEETELADISVTGLEETLGDAKLSGTGIICLEETLEETELADTSVTGLEETLGDAKLSGTGVICLEETPETELADTSVTGLEETLQDREWTDMPVTGLEGKLEWSEIPFADETDTRGSNPNNLNDSQIDCDIQMEVVNEKKEANDIASLSDEKPLQGEENKDIMFERRSFLSRSWSNLQIKEIRPKDLNCSSFEELLAEMIPFPSPRINNSKRRRIYEESTKCSNNYNNMFRAFLCYAFPPIQITARVAKQLQEITYEFDRMPQFTCVCSSSVRNKIRVSIRCEICSIYEESCLRRGLFTKMGKSTQKVFDGISQVLSHQQSRVHQASALYLSGLKELDHDTTTKGTVA